MAHYLKIMAFLKTKGDQLLGSRANRGRGTSNEKTKVQALKQSLSCICMISRTRDTCLYSDGEFSITNRMRCQK